MSTFKKVTNSWSIIAVCCWLMIEHYNKRLRIMSRFEEVINGSSIMMLVVG